MIPSIHTPHLLLRPWKPEDAEIWYNLLREEGILRYFPNPSPPQRERADRYIAHHLDQWEKRGYGHWAVVNKQDDQVVGWNGLEYLPEINQTEVAYLLSKLVWGKGYATEAARAAIKFGFEVKGLNSIIGLVHPENVASIRVLEKCGLKVEDRINLWNIELCRYSIDRTAYTQGIHSKEIDDER
jgi:RimJ/RimL family protein N-acetyltransferase